MGNTQFPEVQIENGQDHPHIHGEYHTIVIPSRLIIGSPPHTWGIRTTTMPTMDISRITPTYMGNTDKTAHAADVEQDHPHIHGEYSRTWARAASLQGSPPHTWGIPLRFWITFLTGRITPTYMGNTRCGLMRTMACEDHPHIHGEYQVPITTATGQTGSPPHTWGILRCRQSC